MRALLLVGLLLGRVTPVGAEPAWGVDKAEHLAISLGLGAGCYAGLRALSRDPPLVRFAFSVGLALVPGLFKELYDSGRPGNRFSGPDLAWDAVGAISGALVALGIDLLVARLRRTPTRNRLVEGGRRDHNGRASCSPGRCLP